MREIAAALALVDFEKKKIKIKKIKNYFCDNDEGFGEEDLVKILTKEIKKISKKTPAIISFEQPFIKSTKTRLSVVRDNPLTAIDHEELENVILNLIWRLYDKERIFVGQKMKISEWDVVLAHSKLSDPRIDDKRVLNPLGFTGKTFSFCVENVYMHCLFWEAVKNVLEQWGGELLFIGEKNLIFDKTFSLINNIEKNILVEIGYTITSAGLITDYLNTAKYFDWGEKNLLLAISQNLSVSLTTATEIKNKYENGDLSENASNWLKKLFDKELKILLDGVNLTAKEISPKEKIEGFYLIGLLKNFPGLIESFEKNHWPVSIFKTPVNIIYYDNERFLSDLEIEVEDNRAANISFNLIPNLVYPFVSEPKYEEMNKILKRRIKWLNQNLLKNYKK
ncbi:MAG: hypothetical protein ACPLKV_00955 [Minisyncoccia bacterium]